MQRFGIDRNVRRAAAFIAQLAHESGQFRYMEELWGPTEAQKRYEPTSTLSRKLGNKERGDGFRYKGRGPIQITGRDNYRRYGELLGADLEAEPQQAATPEVGFAIAGLYWERNRLNEFADAGDFEQITRRINGGLNGLEDRQRFHERALRVLAPVFPAGAPPVPMPPDDGGEAAQPLPRGAEVIREGAPRAASETTGATRRKPRPAEPPPRTFDARPDTADFRDQLYQPTLIEVPTHVPLGDYLDFEVPILDQGKEGACTGFGLATVANYLLLRRRVLPDRLPVSARMLYTLARRYDEWPGEDYEGSSARGAMKGWHKHGVCKEASYPSCGTPDREGLTEARTSEARRCPLGAYFRVNHRDLVAMHSALSEVGVLYATCVVHQGWEQVGADGSHPTLRSGARRPRVRARRVRRPGLLAAELVGRRLGLARLRTDQLRRLAAQRHRRVGGAARRAGHAAAGAVHRRRALGIGRRVGGLFLRRPAAAHRQHRQRRQAAPGRRLRQHARRAAQLCSRTTCRG